MNFTVLGHLEKSTWYIFQVRAVSMIGLGQFSENQFMQTYDGKTIDNYCMFWQAFSLDVL